jgi:Tol biopolymer transport system component/DNA-binding winged helix-turn-helix (wHTH) protein
MHDQRSTPPRVRFGPFDLDVRSGELRKGAGRLKVPDKSIEILRTLLEQPGELVTREALRDRLWPANTFVDFEHGLNAAVRRLRDALGDSAEAPQFIETLPRRGYRFIGTLVSPPSGEQPDSLPVPLPPPLPAAAINAGEPIATSAPPGQVALAASSHRPIRVGRRERLAWLAAGLLALALLGTLVVVWPAPPRVPDEAMQFIIAPPTGMQFGPTPEFAVSPDGRLFVYVAESANETHLWLKSRSSTAVTRLPDTSGASSPFWSADGQQVGFFAARKLKKHRIGAATSEALCDAPFGRGGSWNARDEIVFAPSTDSGLMKIGAAGGQAVPVTSRDADRGDTTHRDPHFLPDGRHFLFSAGGGAAPGEIQVGSLDPAEPVKSLGLHSAEGPRADGPKYGAGHILFIEDQRLYAQPFDADAQELKPGRVTIAEDVTAFTVSAGSVLAHATTRRGVMAWFDRAGKRLATVADKSFMVALTQDDARLATTVWGGELMLHELGRPTAPRRITHTRANDFFPVWAPDGRDVVFASTRNTRMQIFRKPADLSRVEALLLDSTPPRNAIAPTDWSSDGKYIAYTESGGSEPTQIWMLPLSGSRAPYRFRQANAHQGNAHFSPNGKWVVFTSEELGSRGQGSVSRREVVVAPFAGADPTVQISENGGLQPSWSHDGNEIFFLSPDGALMSARVTQGRRFSARPARQLFRVAVDTSRGWGNQYAASRDGRRFLINALDEPRHITFVLDWPAMMKRPPAR